MQALTRNPLADPGLLGVNAGASAAVVVAIGFLGVAGPTGYIWFAFLGAAVGVGRRLRDRLARAAAARRRCGWRSPARRSRAALLLDRRRDHADRRRRCSTQVQLLVGRRARRPRLRRSSSRSCRSSSRARSLALLLARALNALALGDDTARALGAHVGRTRVLGAVAITLLCGAATAAAGPIVFLGLTVPHVARAICGPDQRWVLALLRRARRRAAARSPTSSAACSSAPGELQAGIMHRVHRRARCSSLLVRRKRHRGALMTVVDCRPPHGHPRARRPPRQRRLAAGARAPGRRRGRCSRWSARRCSWSRSGRATSRRAGRRRRRAGRRRRRRDRLHRARAAAAARPVRAARRRRARDRRRDLPVAHAQPARLARTSSGSATGASRGRAVRDHGARAAAAWPSSLGALAGGAVTAVAVYVLAYPRRRHLGLPADPGRDRDQRPDAVASIDFLLARARIEDAQEATALAARLAQRPQLGGRRARSRSPLAVLLPAVAAAGRARCGRSSSATTRAALGRARRARRASRSSRSRSRWPSVTTRRGRARSPSSRSPRRRSRAGSPARPRRRWPARRSTGARCCWPPTSSPSGSSPARRCRSASMTGAFGGALPRVAADQPSGGRDARMTGGPAARRDGLTLAYDARVVARRPRRRHPRRRRSRRSSARTPAASRRCCARSCGC